MPPCCWLDRLWHFEIVALGASANRAALGISAIIPITSRLNLVTENLANRHTGAESLGILPVGGLALLLGVERFMSEVRAATNLFSNIFATVVVARWMGELDDERLRLVLDADPDADPLKQPVLAREAQG